MNIKIIVVSKKTLDFFSNPNFEIIELNSDKKVYKSLHYEKEDKDNKKVKIFSFKEVKEMEIEPINWIIPNFLPEGLAIIGGRPKMGKSFLCLNIAVAVASGLKALSYFDTIKQRALYISFEDYLRRLQDRLNLMRIEHEIPLLSFSDEFVFPKLDETGLEEIEKLLAEENFKLIIIDTLVRAQKKFFGRNKNPYFDEYQFTGELQKLALKYHACILIVHHTSKPRHYNVDVFDSYNGTTGISAAADTLIILENQQGNTNLHVKGRDVGYNKYRIEFIEEIATWQISEKSNEIEITIEERKVIDLFDNDFSKILSLTEISTAIEKSQQNTSKLLKRLITKGFLEKTAHGHYKLKSKDINSISIEKESIFKEVK